MLFANFSKGLYTDNKHALTLSKMLLTKTLILSSTFVRFSDFFLRVSWNKKVLDYRTSFSGLAKQRT